MTTASTPRGCGPWSAKLARLGEVYVVAPSTEQSGVGHSITYLTPLTVKEVFDQGERRGWAVDGSPADCVKLGLFECCPGRPDLVVSGMNGGLNAGINVLYSGTVAAAIEGAFFGITSVAVSLEFDEHADFGRAAAIARRVIERIVAQQVATPQLYNLNIPTAALTDPDCRVQVVPMGLIRYGDQYEKRIDPRGRSYFWATNEPAPPPGEHQTDLTALRQGFITLTPLHFDLTERRLLDAMGSWNFDLGAAQGGER